MRKISFAIGIIILCLITSGCADDSAEKEGSSKAIGESQKEVEI